MIDADQRAFETHFTCDDSTQLSFQELVDAQHSMFHFWKVTQASGLRLLSHKLEACATFSFTISAR